MQSICRSSLCRITISAQLSAAALWPGPGWSRSLVIWLGFMILYQTEIIKQRQSLLIVRHNFKVAISIWRSIPINITFSILIYKFFFKFPAVNQHPVMVSKGKSGQIIICRFWNLKGKNSSTFLPFINRVYMFLIY